MMVTMVMFKWIIENKPVTSIMYPKNSCECRMPLDPPRPRDRATSHAPSSLRDPRRMNGRRAKARRATIYQHISFWLSGRALDSGRAERQFKSPCLCFLFSFVCFSSAVLLYCCCCTVVHSGFVGCWWMVFSAVYCA